MSVDGALRLPPAGVAELPPYFRKTDWERTGLAIAAVALLVVLVAASARDDGPRRGHVRFHHLGGPRGPVSPRRPPVGPPSRRGYLQPDVLEPGEAREGLVFFRLDGPVADWRTARLVENR